jgi:hypothetical protein
MGFLLVLFGLNLHVPGDTHMARQSMPWAIGAMPGLLLCRLNRR